jgi:hypothetical protein
MTYTFTLELRDESGRDIERMTMFVTANRDSKCLARVKADIRASDIVADTPKADDYRLYSHQ